MGLFPQITKKTVKKQVFVSKLIILAIIIFSFVAAAQIVLELFEINKNGNIQGSTIEVEVPLGASTKDVAEILKEKGLIKSTMVFRILSKINENDGKYKQGKHVFNSSMDYDEIMEELKKNVTRQTTITFTIPEGFEIQQIAARLADIGLVDEKKFIELAQTGNFNYPFLKAIPNRKYKLEGYLFPDTYEVYGNATEEEIIEKMLDRFEQIFTKDYYKRAESLGMTVDEVVTLASIIEREAKLDKERPIVSAVFHNRLKSKEYPLLQSCATVQYILGERKPILSVEDTKIDSPYNTYVYPGLPIGPIASPGKASIDAALYPENVDYMFFVANSDGSHIFSKTYQGHLEAMKKTK